MVDFAAVNVAPATADRYDPDRVLTAAPDFECRRRREADRADRADRVRRDFEANRARVGPHLDTSRAGETSKTAETFEPDLRLDLDLAVVLNHRCTFARPLERATYMRPSLPLRFVPGGHLLAGYGGPGRVVYFLVVWRSHMGYSLQYCHAFLLVAGISCPHLRLEQNPGP